MNAKSASTHSTIVKKKYCNRMYAQTYTNTGEDNAMKKADEEF